MVKEVVKYNPSLYDLEESLMVAFQQITEAHAAGEEVPEEAAALIATYADAAPAKRDRCAQFLRHLESLETNIETEIKRLQDKAGRTEAARERFEGYILAVMERVGKTRLEGDTYTFTAKTNPPSVKIENPTLIPAEFLRPAKPAPPQDPDKTAIKKAIQGGEEVPGASLITGKKRLTVE